MSATKIKPKEEKNAEYSETYKYVFERISSYFEIFLSKSYVLDHSESNYMRLEK